MLSLLASFSASWVLPGRLPGSRQRAGVPMACTPFRSDDEFDYFRRTKELTVELTKPLGAVLEETAAGGVAVEDIVEGGSAMETGLLKKRDRLLDISGTDVSGASFDEVMEVLGGAEDPLTLSVSRGVIVKKKRAVQAAPYLTIEGGNSGEVMQGVILRTAIQQSGSELYRGMDKLTNCGGVGQCRSCVVEVLEGGENLSPITDAEKKMLAKKGPSYRLACQAFVNGDVKIEVPQK